MRQLLLLGLVVFLTACVGIPEGVRPVANFELARYLGTWYEIARLDHSFERGLTDVTAEYSLREDGGINVVNSGYDTTQKRRSVAEGKAYFIGTPDIGRLKVSFFWPFYGAYNIIALDKINYRYVMIAGSNTDYLWIMARTPTLETEVLEALLAKAEALGFPTTELIYP